MMAVNFSRTAIEPVHNRVSLMLENGEGNAFTCINELILLMKKLNIEMRDVLRGFHDEMQKVAFEKQLTSLDSKQEAIQQKFNASLATSITQIVAGYVGLVGAGVGAGWNSQFSSAAASGLAKTTEGLGSLSASLDEREAQQLQLQGEFQSVTADNLGKTLSTLAERAAEASRQLREATRELLGLYERLASAVQVRTR